MAYYERGRRGVAGRDDGRYSVSYTPRWGVARRQALAYRNSRSGMEGQLPQAFQSPPLSAQTGAKFYDTRKSRKNLDLANPNCVVKSQPESKTGRLKPVCANGAFIGVLSAFSKILGVVKNLLGFVQKCGAEEGRRRRLGRLIGPVATTDRP